MYGREDEYPDNGDHIYRTTSLFYKYSRIGFIGGQIKEKYGTIRWYAQPRPIIDLHEMFYPGYAARQWTEIDNPILDIVNNVSILFFDIQPIRWMTFKYKVLIYNLAYYHAMKLSPGYEREILASCDGFELLWRHSKLEEKYMK